MRTRTAMILKWADEQSTQAIDRVPDKHSTRKNTLKKLQIVCRALVSRKRPIRPSAAEVAESGLAKNFGFDSFPSRQTIYNDYSEILNYWRKAYDDIKNLDAEPAAPSEELLEWDATHLDAGSQELIRALQRLVREQIQRNNALRRLITDHIPVDLDSLSPEDNEVANDLAYWMSTVESDGFAFTEFGLVVTSRTGPGTMVMDRSLWEG